ncbi:hypothetical protein BO94DRAFT_114620 [Aspergillus sclerotioniger CBS 115572]|uniref:Uncharacterized protein n=1 Tax=Aspergillus sclerotioniger CBS 115572 TaxID=1450535 RepID=A0A317WDD5_9EURO|nr:hypothetical protein BO94DRAFT_114620 [Aspergillus sclerotioniger CBS 115572]PWY83771.1 hypothetical protein BO94DRAFT_114620 [Aspergillus sclerotioniger CBS 115572]
MRIAHDWAAEIVGPTCSNRLKACFWGGSIMIRPTHPCPGGSFIRFCLPTPASTVRSRVADRSRHQEHIFIPSRFYNRHGFAVVRATGLSLDPLDPAQTSFFLCTSISLNGVGSGVVQMGVAYDDF